MDWFKQSAGFKSWFSWVLTFNFIYANWYVSMNKKWTLLGDRGDVSLIFCRLWQRDFRDLFYFLGIWLCHQGTCSQKRHEVKMFIIQNRVTHWWDWSEFITAHINCINDNLLSCEISMLAFDFFSVCNLALQFVTKQ